MHLVDGSPEVLRSGPVEGYVTLESDPIHAHTACSQPPNHLERFITLVCSFEIVVVVVELAARAVPVDCLGSVLKRQIDERGIPKNAVPLRALVGAAPELGRSFANHFIGYVPVVHHVGIAFYDPKYVLPKPLSESLWREHASSVGEQPLWLHLVPKQRVPSHSQLIAPSELRNLVSRFPSVLSGGRTQPTPFHRVLGRNSPKVLQYRVLLLE